MVGRPSTKICGVYCGGLHCHLHPHLPKGCFSLTSLPVPPRRGKAFIYIEELAIDAHLQGGFGTCYGDDIERGSILVHLDVAEIGFIACLTVEGYLLVDRLVTDSADVEAKFGGCRQSFHAKVAIGLREHATHQAVFGCASGIFDDDEQAYRSCFYALAVFAIHNAAYSRPSPPGPLRPPPLRGPRFWLSCANIVIVLTKRT